MTNRVSALEFATSLNILALIGVLVIAVPGYAVDSLLSENPLEPTDRSSPRATLASFLEHANQAWGTSLPSAESGQDSALVQSSAFRAERCLDVSQVPPAELEDTARESVIMLLDVLNRIPIPDLGSVPDSNQAAEMGLESWQIPGTAITIAKVEEGDQAGQWLFTSEVVNRLPDFYRVTRDLELNQGAVVEDGYQLYNTLGGSLVPNEWVLALPQWAQRNYLKQAVWQWLSGILLLVVTAVLAVSIIRLARFRNGVEENGTISFLLAPVLLMILSDGALYLFDEQLNFTGEILSILRILLMLAYYLAAAWLVVRIGVLVGHRVKSSTRFGKEALDHDLVDAVTFFSSLFVAVLILASGASKMGIPLAGVLTGLGVGGIAVALAAQSTLENLLGGFTLFLDRPIRVGDYCKFGDRSGTVERIGLRSTRIRTLERTIISVPNSEFSKAQIESLAARDKLLMKEILYVRMHTSTTQVRQVLEGLREVLRSDALVDSESVRVRLVGLGPEALEVEVNAYVTTNNWSEFLEAKEGIYLEFMRIVEEAGTSFVPPGQIQYNIELDPISSNTINPSEQ